MDIMGQMSQGEPVVHLVSLPSEDLDLDLLSGRL